MHNGTYISGTSFSVGNWGKGTLNQHGGTITTNSETRIGASSTSAAEGYYNLYDGSFTTSNLHIASYSGATGELNQYGGTVTANGTVYCSFQSNTSGKYTLDGPAAVLNSRGTLVGRYANGSFIYNNGTHNLDGELTIGSSAPLANNDLNGGSLTVTGHTYVGRSYGTGNFTQTAGSSDFQRVYIAYSTNSNGTFTISGGDTTITHLQVGSSYAGNFAITDPAASVTITASLTIGPQGSLQIAPGSSINFTGSNFTNQSSNPANWAHTLADATLIFQPSVTTIDQFEVSSTDLGADSAGFTDNCIGTLVVGGANPAQIQLVDLYDNQGDGSSNEILYVRNLVLKPGSTLDLNGIDLYYNTLTIDPSVSILANGATFAQVSIPEPATIFLLLPLLAFLFVRCSWQLKFGTRSGRM